MMGTSGAAFSTTIDAGGWDPLAAAPLDDDTLRRGARAAGTRPDVVVPPFDDEMRELVLARVAELVDAGTPVLARGLVGPAEYGLVVGYDEGPTFFARTYFDKTDAPTKVDWSAFRDERAGQLVFLDRAGAPDRAPLARDAVGHALTTATAGDAALEAWAAALRDEGRWSDARHTGTAAFADHAMRTLLHDKRRAAARFLRASRGLFATTPGGDLLRAAESYGYVADLAQKHGVGTFDASVAARFLDAGHRRAWAKALDAALGHERDAHAALAAARDTMR